MLNGNGADGGRYKWVALSNTTLGMLMATIDASIVIIAMPAIFRGIHLDPLAPGNVSYLLWMIIGYLLVSAVLVVTLGRLGDMYGRVRMYNLGFVVFTLASIALSLDPFTGSGGALWLILLAAGAGRRRGDADGQLGGDPHRRVPGRASAAWRSASTRSPAIAGQFLGLLLGGLLAAVDWRAVFWVNVPIGIFGTIWSYAACARSRTHQARPHRLVGQHHVRAWAPAALLVAITYGIQPYGGHPTGWRTPGARRPGRRRRRCSSRSA